MHKGGDKMLNMCAMPPYLSDVERLTQQTYIQIFHRLERMALCAVKWEGLPNITKQMLIERQLFYTGASVFFYDEILEMYLTLPISGQYSWDENGLPIEYEVTGFRDYRRRLNVYNSVIIYNDYQLTPSSFMAQIFASRLCDTLRTCDVHLNKHKIGKIISTPETQSKGIKKVIEKIKNFDMYQVVSPTVMKDFKDAVVLDTEMDSILPDLDNHYRFLWHDCMAYWGVNSISDKKAGMSPAEISADSGLAEIDKYAVLNTRQEACEKINEMFGLNVSVKYATEGRESNVQVYNNTKGGNGVTDRKDGAGNSD